MSSSSTTVTNLFAALEAVSEIPEGVEVSSLMPTFTFDAHSLVRSVTQLWAALKDQRGFLTLVEKEMSRRKTETDIKLKNSQSDLEAQIMQEARKRTLEIEKVKNEANKGQEQVRELAETLRREAKENQENMNRMVDRALTTIKVSVAGVQDDIGKMRSQQHDIREELRAQDEKLINLTNRVGSMQQGFGDDVKTICHFSGVQLGDMREALKTKNEKEVWLQTPQFQEVKTKQKIFEEKIDNTRRDVFKLQSSTNDLAVNLSALDAEVQKLKSLRDTLAQQTVELRQYVQIENAKFGRKIDDIERLLATKATASAEEGQDNVANKSEVMAAIESIQTELAALRTQLHTTNEQLDQKADVNYVDVQFNNLLSRFKKVAEQVNALEEDVGMLTAKMARGRNASVSEGTAGASNYIGQSKVDTINEQIEDMLKRIAEVEQKVMDLMLKEDPGVTREEMDAALQAAMNSLERAIAALTEKMQNSLLEFQQSTQQQHTEILTATEHATAGRFRCLSCNRDAGPLNTNVKERLSKSQFPPSSMFVSGSGVRDPSPTKTGYTYSSGVNPVLAATQHRKVHVPGSTGSSSQMTSSRKKLLNYYEWLQNRSDEKGFAQHQVSQQQQHVHFDGINIHQNSGQVPKRPQSAGAERDSPPRSKSPPWSGTHGMHPGERQCGNHGSSQPEAIGFDGKFYDGVQGEFTHVSTSGAEQEEPPNTLNATTTPSSENKVMRPKSAPSKRSS